MTDQLTEAARAAFRTALRSETDLEWNMLAEFQIEHWRGVARAVAAALEIPVPAGLEWHLELFVSGRAAPQGSKHARPIYRGNGANREFTGKVVNVESSKSGVDAWRGDVRAACATVWAGRAPLDGPLVLEVEFIRKRPAGAPKSYAPDANTQPDLSKLVRSTEDAITSAGVWTDDGRVIHTVSSKRCADIEEVPGAHIRIGRRTPAREKWLAAKENQAIASTRSLPERAAGAMTTAELHAEIAQLRARLADDDQLLAEVRELRAEFARLAPDVYGSPRPAELASLICQARRVADAFPGGAS